MGLEEVGCLVQIKSSWGQGSYRWQIHNCRSWVGCCGKYMQSLFCISVQPNGTTPTLVSTPGSSWRFGMLALNRHGLLQLGNLAVFGCTNFLWSEALSQRDQWTNHGKKRWKRCSIKAYFVGRCQGKTNNSERPPL